MKKILLLNLFLTFIITAKLVAQSKEDVMYLVNGSILRGKITESVKNEKYTIEIIGRNTLVIPDSSVKLILLDQSIPSNQRVNSASPVEMTSCINFYGGSENSGGFTFVTSYKFPFRLSTGFGIGIEWFDHQQIPFMADVRYSFLKGSWTPVIYAQAGYAIPLSGSDKYNFTEYYGGIMAGAGAGMQFNFNKRNALVFNIGYRYQKTKTIGGLYGGEFSSYLPYETERIDIYNRITFSFGFLFN